MTLTCENLSKAYLLDRGYLLHAVDKCSLSVSGGELVCIRGGSGSGKTSLLRLLALLGEPDSGEIILDGRSLIGISDRDAAAIRSRELGYVPQTFELVPILSARENIELVLTIHGKKSDSERLFELVERLNIKNCLSSLPGRLSGGQRQRVAIARSLLYEPGIILADEPTSNLDDENLSRVAELFREACSRGIGILAATHDERLLRHADRVLKMESGKLS